MTTVVYISNADSGDITVLQMAPESGALTAPKSTVVGGAAGPLAISPDRRFLYVARRSEPLAVLGFAIDPQTGELASLGDSPLPASMAYLSVARSGRHLFSASYGGHRIAVGSVADDGVPQAVQQVLATPPNAHAVLIDPSNRFVLATSLGGDVVLQFRFDATRGQLSPNEPATVPVRQGAGPRHLVFSPEARFVYLLNELDGTVDVFGFDRTSGLLSATQTVQAMPAGVAGAPWAADIHLTPDGRFLYASERRSSTLAMFRVAADNGHLALIGHVPTEAQPRGFSIDPRGKFLLAVGQQSHHVTVYSIDAASGDLAPLARHRVGRGPHWVEIVDLP